MSDLPILRIVASIILLLATPFVATAQYSESATAAISANVRDSEIEIITMNSLDLIGVQPVNNIVNIDPVLNTRAGKMMASGNPNARFTIAYDVVRELANLTGQGLIFLEYAVSGNSLDEQDTSELFEEESRELQFSADGEFFFWIGGRIDLSQATPGSYEGEFTIEIEYL